VPDGPPGDDAPEEPQLSGSSREAAPAPAADDGE
jgi:hypothetical protein